MSEQAQIEDFREALRHAIDDFARNEAAIRDQYSRDSASGQPLSHDVFESLLERPTRRFLIDRVLRHLDWNPDDPGQVSEEARTWDEQGSRLYFDYVGIAPATRDPVLVVEAKGYDIRAAHAAHETERDARETAGKVSAALADLKAKKVTRAVTTEWSGYLGDLHAYVNSLGSAGSQSLRRVVITAGRWMMVFQDPYDAFVRSGPPAVDRIHCFLSFDELLAGHRKVFQLLHRQRLVNTLPLLIPLSEAIRNLRPGDISKIFRGVVVATRETGSMRMPYPTRSIWPAIIVMSAGAVFAVHDYRKPTAEEPFDVDDFEGFAAELAEQGAVLEDSFKNMTGRNDLGPSSLDEFAGFARPGIDPIDIAPVPDSTAARQAAAPKRRLIVAADDGDGTPEYVVVTGQDWFYKRETPRGPTCRFHEFPKAKAARVSSEMPIGERSQKSYTVSGEDWHCAHEILRMLRDARCHVDVLESHLCCRSCIFFDDCWTEATDLRRMPCP